MWLQHLQMGHTQKMREFCWGSMVFSELVFTNHISKHFGGCFWGWWVIGQKFQNDFISTTWEGFESHKSEPAILLSSGRQQVESRSSNNHLLLFVALEARGATPFQSCWTAIAVHTTLVLCVLCGCHFELFAPGDSNVEAAIPKWLFLLLPTEIIHYFGMTFSFGLQIWMPISWAITNSLTCLNDTPWIRESHCSASWNLVWCLLDLWWFCQWICKNISSTWFQIVSCETYKTPGSQY